MLRPKEQPSITDRGINESTIHRTTTLCSNNRHCLCRFERVWSACSKVGGAGRGASGKGASKTGSAKTQSIADHQELKIHMQRVARIVARSAIVISLVFPETAFAAPPAVASPNGTSPQVCHKIKGEVHVPEAPRGFANVVTATLTKDCLLVVSQPKMVADPQPSGSAEVVKSSASGVLSQQGPVAGPPSAVRPSAGDPVATSYYRLWDLANKKLNGSATSINWTTSNGNISSASPTLYTTYLNDGWFLNYHALRWNGGCIGCTTQALNGEAEFCFDGTCTPWDNIDDNFITANGNGSYSNCYSSWFWNLGAPGWHTQVWCGWGYTGI